MPQVLAIMGYGAGLITIVTADDAQDRYRQSAGQQASAINTIPIIPTSSECFMDFL